MDAFTVTCSSTCVCLTAAMHVETVLLEDAERLKSYTSILDAHDTKIGMKVKEQISKLTAIIKWN